jgi:putative sigma-54 modulation protein
MQVTIDTESNQKIAEATLHLDTGSEVFAKATNENLFVAIDSLSDKIDRQLQKTKSKIKINFLKIDWI